MSKSDTALHQTEQYPTRFRYRQDVKNTQSNQSMPPLPPPPTFLILHINTVLIQYSPVFLVFNPQGGGSGIWVGTGITKVVK